MQQKIEILRDKLALSTTGVITHYNQDDNGPMMPVVPGVQVGANCVSNENQECGQRSTRVNRACENGCRCNSTVQDDLNSVRLSDNQGRYCTSCVLGKMWPTQ
jgi:hypothetical protein